MANNSLLYQNRYPIVAPTPRLPGMPYGPIQQGSPSVYGPSRQSTPSIMSVPGASGLGASLAQSGLDAANSLQDGNVQGVDTYNYPTPVDPSGFYSGGSGGGGASYGGYETLAAQIKAQQQQLADTERGNINARRDALVGDISGGYTDQMAYLDSQTQGIRGNAEGGKASVIGQRDATINRTLQDAENAQRSARDTYKDLILQGRRRARATGGGSSSGYLEMTTMLDNQLMRGLSQVDQNKQSQVGAANQVADQAVAQIENSLQQALGEIANNRATSLRERDSKINEAKLNAADALLEVDKWLAQAFSDIETAKLSMRTGGGGGSRASFDKTGYAAAQAKNVGDTLGIFQSQINEAQRAGKYSNDIGLQLFNNIVPLLQQNGQSADQIAKWRGLYFPSTGTPSVYTDFTSGDEERRRMAQEYLTFNSELE